MPRPQMERILGTDLTERGFRPSGVAGGKAEEVVLTLDEAESLRLADLEGLYQQAAALRMGVSRPTFGRIIESARRKTADALINGKRLRIEGGHVSLGETADFPVSVAIPTDERGRVEEHFGRSSRFTIYSMDADGGISSEGRLEASIGPGCRSASAAKLAEMGVSVLLVGCIGDGAVHVFSAHGIKVVRGVSGRARAAAVTYIQGRLEDSGKSCEGECHSFGRRCID